MRVLVVGAGATGTVFGHALAAGGAEVGFHVREHHRERLLAGLPLTRQGLLTSRADRLAVTTVCTTPAAAGDFAPDQVWLTVPSDQLQPDWLAPLLAATGTATIVVLQPDPEDVSRVRALGGDHRRVVQGLIQFSAWQAPLPHEPADREGITWVAPPGPAALFDAECPEAATLAATLTRGGLRAATHDNLPAHAARMSALVNPLVAGLELAGWRLDRLRGHAVLSLAVAAAREAVDAESARHGSPVPLAMRVLLNAPLTGLVTRALPLVPGFPAEDFLAWHFGKVGRQTRQLLATYRRHAGQLGLPHAALDRLIAALPPA